MALQVKAFVIKFGTRKVNGKYVQDGTADGVPKFMNAEGVCLFRTRLYETPELGITVESMKHVQVISSDAVLAVLPYMHAPHRLVSSPTLSYLSLKPLAHSDPTRHPTPAVRLLAWLCRR